MISNIWIEHTKVGLWFNGPVSGGTNVTVSPLPSNPGSVTSPSVGAPYYTPSSLGLNPSTVTPATLAAAELGTDASGRPLFPSLYITDITNVTAAHLDDPVNHAGDWQYGGAPLAPSPASAG